MKLQVLGRHLQQQRDHVHRQFPQYYPSRRRRLHNEQVIVRFFRYKTGYGGFVKLKVIGFMSAKTGITPLNASRTALLLRPPERPSNMADISRAAVQSEQGGLLQYNFCSSRFSHAFV